MFSIHSANSDRELIFRDRMGEKFVVELKGLVASATMVVWEYPEAPGLNALFEELVQHKQPWQGVLSWESIEQDFSLAVTCTKLGQVRFAIRLSGLRGSTEAWHLEAGLDTALGQLERIAKDSRTFFERQSA